MTTNELRQRYLDFMAKKGHAIVPSASLMPENDPTTLFTGSGMQPMVPFLLGEAHPQGDRIADSQKCFRAQDIEEVGDNRHTTFFEMLGNWSLGDYFKEEQIPWMFDFLVNDAGLNPENLYVTVFRGNDALDIPRDTQSVTLWQKAFATVGLQAEAVDFSEKDGMQNGRIFYYDESKNWWSRSGVPANMPVGEPGGPDTEMFYDFGADRGLHEVSEWKDLPCHVNCDCGRFLEIGNNVFMQFRKTEDGFEPLPKQNVDFGGGLERIMAAINEDPDIFNIDLFSEAREAIEKTSGVSYADATYAYRVILDHLRAAVFLIADGVVPSNKDQGYFTRRLIRRAVRYGLQLGLEDAFCAEIAQGFIDAYGDSYPELAKGAETIKLELEKEEQKFRKTLRKGEKAFEKMFAKDGNITGEDAFTLYASFGFPLELTEEMAREKGQEVDAGVFSEEFKKHQELSRQGAEQKFAGGLADHSEASTQLHTATHLLHKALKNVLGDHVEQKGSNITPERLRFDFSHGEKMTPEQKREVEEMVNAQIQKDLPMTFEMMSVEDAKAAGAIGLFEDTYASIGDQIKVYTAGDEASGVFSKEICGGPHVERTGSLEAFAIKKEEASSAGVRRIKAVVGDAAKQILANRA